LAQSKTVKFKEHVFTDFPMLKELIKDEWHTNYKNWYRCIVCRKTIAPIP
jgi:hypothetical protein